MFVTAILVGGLGRDAMDGARAARGAAPGTLVQDLAPEHVNCVRVAYEAPDEHYAEAWRHTLHAVARSLSLVLRGDSVLEYGSFNFENQEEYGG